MKKSLLALLILLTAVSVHARKGPNHQAIRALGMGNAFVAVAEDRDAIYYNPAGLNLMGKLGNYDRDPEMGHYPDNWLDMRLSLVTSLLLPDLFGLGIDGWNFYDEHRKTLHKLKNDALVALVADDDFFEDAQVIDGLLFPIGLRPMHGEIAFHNFGAALWSEATVRPAFEMGVVTPSAVIEEISATAVGQLAFAFGIGDRVSLGFGYRMVERASMERFEISVVDGLSPTQLEDRLSDEIDTLLDRNVTLDHALDFGLMVQASREIRVGAALQNVFVTDYDGESVTPELTVGLAWAPRKLQRNTAYARKVNFALDFEDALNDDRNYKPLSHVNFGFEVEQVLVAIPSLKWGSNARALKGRGAMGFKGGYFTLGAGLEVLRVLNFEFVTWAEEAGYYTGQAPERFFLFEFSFGL